MCSFAENAMDNKLCVGVDMVEIKRIGESIQKNALFLMRFFGEEERKLFCGKKAYERAAASFAAKEAFGKAIGRGIVGFSLKEVEALRMESGQPYLKLSGKAKEIADEMGLTFSISLSHTDDMAIAVVIGVAKE